MSPEIAPKSVRVRARVVRWTVLALVLIAITTIGYAHHVLRLAKPPGVDALCPFGGLETMFALITSGHLIKRVALSSVILLAATLIMAVVLRRSFCGQICPLGFLQELSGGLGMRLFGRRFAVPAWLDRPARLLKYLVLVASVGLAWAASSLVIRPYDPWAAYMHLTSAEVFTRFGVGLGVLAATLAGSMLYDRFFCKYLCPMGAFLALFSKLSLFKIRRSVSACIDCKACDRVCPMNITVSTATTVENPECITCNECLNACPCKDALEVRTKHGFALYPLGATFLVTGILVAVILGSAAVGQFQWRAPSRAQENGAGSGNGQGWRGGSALDPGTFDVSLIRGRTTLREVADASGMPPDLILQVFGVPVADQGLPIKEIKDRYGFTPEDVRAFVELYRSDPAAAAAFRPSGSEE